MHVRHADQNFPQAQWGCGRHADADAQVTLRRKALLEVAATASAMPPAPNPAATNATPIAATTSATPDAGTYDLTAMRRQKGSLSILTQDGDSVQIRFRTREGLAAQSTTHTTADGTTSSTSVYAFASGRVQVAVEGELDADELKAIGNLLDKVDSLATQFFDGDAEAAFSAASALGFDSGEIAGFALRLSVKEFARATVTAPAAAPPAAPAADPAPADAAPAATPTPPASAPETTVPVEATTDPVVAPVADPAPDPAPVAGTAPAPSPPAGNAADPAATLQQSMGNFLKQVLDGLASVNGAGRAEFSMRWKLQVMIQAVQTAPAALTTDPAGTQLATDSLDKLSSAQP